MTALYVCYFLVILLFLFGVCVAIFQTRKAWHTLELLDEMVERAVKGDFDGSLYDESLLSSVENKFCDYLSSSVLLEKNLAEEKARIHELISDISHQTKTPIANILLYSDLLAEQSLTAEGQLCVAHLRSQGERLRFLIDALMKISRLEAGILSLCPEVRAVDSFVETALSQVTPKAEAKDISLQFTPSGKIAVFDEKWTTEALFNLLDNAVKYTLAGGRVAVMITDYELFCRIDVSDTGVGIAEEELPQIFQRFYSGTAVCQEEGVGLGLYLSRQIVMSEGGYMKVSSVPGKGSVFSLFLPREELRNPSR